MMIRWLHIVEAKYVFYRFKNDYDADAYLEGAKSYVAVSHPADFGDTLYFSLAEPCGSRPQYKPLLREHLMKVHDENE